MDRVSGLADSSESIASGGRGRQCWLGSPKVPRWSTRRGHPRFQWGRLGELCFDYKIGLAPADCIKGAMVIVGCKDESGDFDEVQIFP